MRDDARQMCEGEPAGRGGLGDVRARAPQTRLRVAALLAFACLACFAFVGAGGLAAPPSAAPAAPPSAAQSRDPGGVDFSKFSHGSQRHASLACAACHARAADNSPRLRLPGHKSCTGCHLQQFVTQNQPMCAICHTTVEGRNPPVKEFPALASFNARFDHAQHNAGDARPAAGCAACHAPSARRGAALSIPAGLGAHATCFACHKPGAQSGGRDIGSCGACHAPAARYARTPADSRAIRFSFSHAAHGPRQRLACADCHQLRAGRAQSQQVTAPRLLQHAGAGRAQSCATCHNGRRAFGESDFGDCRRCHRTQSFRVGG